MSYSDFLHTLQSNFTAALTAGDRLLFETDAAGLFDAYLANLPADERQHHTCSCCRAFVNRFGGLVTIDAAGRQTPALWGDLIENDGIFSRHDTHRVGVAAMHRGVKHAKVKGPFLHADTVWGQPEAGGFTHMHVTPPASVPYARTGKLTARQRMAERREQFGILSRALSQYTLEHLRTALLVLGSNAVYRSDRFLGAVQFLEKLQADRQATQNQALRDNIMWRAIAAAPDGFCHPNSGVIGTLLDDIQAGYPFEDIRRRFESKVTADVYQRATEAPSAGNIRRAEQLFAELGLAPALSRRYLSADEARLDWSAAAAKAPVARPAATPAAESIFGHIAPRGTTAVAVSGLQVPAAKMTWAKFRDTVLPTASRLEALVPADSSRFAALVTAADSQAPNILQWDNPVSWYYAAGIDGEFRRRVTAAGGQYENVDIRATLIWNNRNDLDLMMTTPTGDNIYFGHKKDGTGGFLDIDRNVGGETTTPVENIRWPRGTARPGTYVVRLWNFCGHEPKRQDTPYLLELEVGGQKFTYEGVFAAADRTRVERQVVGFSVDRAGKLVGSVQKSAAISAIGATGNASTWGLEPGTFVPVVGITRSPNLWGSDAKPYFGEHTFFLLDGCRDDLAGRGRGFFTETIRQDLREVRSVLEAHNAQAQIAAVDRPACGLGMSRDSDWNLTLRAQTPVGQQLFVIDRHD